MSLDFLLNLLPLYVRSEPHGMKTFGKVESGEITDCSVVSRGVGGANRSGHAGWN